jgi:hypothetical protein
VSSLFSFGSGSHQETVLLPCIQPLRKGLSRPGTLLLNNISTMASILASSSALPSRTASIISLAPRFLHPYLSALPIPADSESHAESSSSSSSRLATLLPSFNGLIELFPHILLGTPPKRRHTHSRKYMKFAGKGLVNLTSEYPEFLLDCYISCQG